MGEFINHKTDILIDFLEKKISSQEFLILPCLLNLLKWLPDVGTSWISVITTKGGTDIYLAYLKTSLVATTEDDLLVFSGERLEILLRQLLLNNSPVGHANSVMCTNLHFCITMCNT